MEKRVQVANDMGDWCSLNPVIEFEGMVAYLTNSYYLILSYLMFRNPVIELRGRQLILPTQPSWGTNIDVRPFLSTSINPLKIWKIIQLQLSRVT